jgi:hypothetical protein
LSKSKTEDELSWQAVKTSNAPQITQNLRPEILQQNNVMT